MLSTIPQSTILISLLISNANKFNISNYLYQHFRVTVSQSPYEFKEKKMIEKYLRSILRSIILSLKSE